MGKLTITIVAAVAAAAVLVEGSSDPGSPLSPHSQFLRDGRSASSGMGLSPDSDADEHPPHDYSRDLELPAQGKHRGKLRGGHHQSPPDVGDFSIPFDGSDGEGKRWPSSGSFDDRLPPPPDAEEMPPPPGHGPFREGFNHEKVDGRSPPPSPPDGNRPLGPPRGVWGRGQDNSKSPIGGRFDDHRFPTMDQQEGEMPPRGSEDGLWQGSDGRFSPPPDVGDDIPPQHQGRDRGESKLEDLGFEGAVFKPPFGPGGDNRTPPKQDDGHGKRDGKVSKLRVPEHKQPPEASPGSGTNDGKPIKEITLGDHIREDAASHRSLQDSGSFDGHVPTPSDAKGSTTGQHDHESPKKGHRSPLSKPEKSR